MNNHYKITFADLRDVIERHCLDLISKAQEYVESHPMTHSGETLIDLRLPEIVKDPVEIKCSEDEITITFALVSAEFETKFRFTKDHAYRSHRIHNSLNDAPYTVEQVFDIYDFINNIHVGHAVVLLLIYQHLACIDCSRSLTHQTSSADVDEPKTGGVEIDEEEYAKRSTYIKNSCTVNSFTDDGTLDSFIHLTSDDGLFTLGLTATEVNEDKKKDEVYCATLASTVIRMSDYSDKEFFLNHIRNILSREFPKATEDILSQYYDSLPREPDLVTEISNILREAGVDESKIADTAIALIDTFIDPDNEE